MTRLARWIALLLLSLVLPNPFGALCAEEVSFLNGDRVTGRIVKIVADYVLIETAYGPYRLKRGEISLIRFETRPLALAHLKDGSLVEGLLVWDAQDLVLIHVTTRAPENGKSADDPSTDDPPAAEEEERRIPWADVTETNVEGN